MTKSKFEDLLKKPVMLVKCDFSVTESESDRDGDFNSVISVSDGREPSVEIPASDEKENLPDIEKYEFSMIESKTESNGDGDFNSVISV